MKPIWDFLGRAMSVSPALAHEDAHSETVTLLRPSFRRNLDPEGQSSGGCRLTM